MEKDFKEKTLEGQATYDINILAKRLNKGAYCDSSNWCKVLLKGTKKQTHHPHNNLCLKTICWPQRLPPRQIIDPKADSTPSSSLPNTTTTTTKEDLSSNFKMFPFLWNHQWCPHVKSKLLEININLMLTLKIYTIQSWLTLEWNWTQC